MTTPDERPSVIARPLLQLCVWLNERRDFVTASRRIPITDDLTRLVAELSVERE